MADDLEKKKDEPKPGSWGGSRKGAGRPPKPRPEGWKKPRKSRAHRIDYRERKLLKLVPVPSNKNGWQEKFLKGLTEKGTIRYGLELAGNQVTRIEALSAYEKQPEFRKKWEEAKIAWKEHWIELASDVADGKKTGNATLIIFNLKAEYPDKYREAVVIPTPGGSGASIPDETDRWEAPKVVRITETPQRKAN